MWNFIVKFKTVLIIFVAVIGLITGGAYAYKHWGAVPGLLQGIFTDRSQEIKDQYDEELKNKEAQIESYRIQLNKSQAEAKKLRTKVKELEAKYQNVQTPTSVAETKRRLTDLGYPPVR
jgi:Skp family chaperone for outer membrane proteins